MRKYCFMFYCLVFVCGFSGCATLLFKESKKYIHYPIQSGDTLNSISQRFSVSVSELESKNNISDPRKLSIGRILKIPYKGQDLKRDGPPANTARASYGGLPVRGSSSDASNLKHVNLGAAGKYVGQLRMPVTASGTHISSKFGRRWLSFHEGIDLAGPVGTPVYAAHSGKVVYSGSGIKGYGNLVVIKGDGLITVYGHNDRNRVRVGEQVRRGERIADLGQSGKVSGPHVHFETRVQNSSGRYVAVNPIAFFP